MESSGHVYLVGMLERWVQIYRPDSLEYMLLDRSADDSQSRPMKIGGHTPDMYLKDSRLGDTILGEAKTTGDLSTPRSYEQLQDFISYLNYCNGLMLLSVELPARRAARALIDQIIRKNKFTKLTYNVITPLDLM